MISNRDEVTYEAHEKEQDLEASADWRHAIDVAVPNSWHGYHKEIHTLPVTQLLSIFKVRRVAGIFKLHRRVWWKWGKKKTITFIVIFHSIFCSTTTFGIVLEFGREERDDFFQASNVIQEKGQAD